MFARSRVRPDTVDFGLHGGPFLERALTWAREMAPTSQIVVFPFSDRMADTMHSARGLLKDPFRPVLAPEFALDRLLNKALSLSCAEDAGLSVPQWVEVRSLQDLGMVRSLPPPLIVKPSSWATAGGHPFKLSVHDDSAEAIEFCRTALLSGAHLIVQQFLSVPADQVEFGIVWASADGSVVDVCTGRKRRQSSDDGGVMAWGETEELTDLRALAIEFVKKSGFTGPGGIEFIRDSEGLRFIEFNPRLEAIHFLAAAAGLDTVALAYLDIGGGILPGARSVQFPAAAWIGSAWLSRLRANPASIFRFASDRIKFALHPRATRAVLCWQDPWPSLAVTKLLAKAGFDRLLSRVDYTRVIL